MKNFYFIFKLISIILFLLLIAGHNKTNKNKEYLSCLKLSIKNCKVNTKKRKENVIKNCKIIVMHNQRISQVDNFYTCKHRR